MSTLDQAEAELRRLLARARTQIRDLATGRGRAALVEEPAATVGDITAWLDDAYCFTHSAQLGSPDLAGCACNCCRSGCCREGEEE